MEIIEDNLHPKVLKNRLFINAIDYLIEQKVVEDQKGVSARTGITEAALSNIRNDKKIVSDKTIRKFLEGFPDIFNPAYFKGENIYMTLKEAMEAKMYAEEQKLVKEESTAQPQPIDQSSLVNAALAAKDETIAALRSQLADLRMQLVDKQNVIDVKDQLIDNLKMQINNMMSEMQIRGISTYPFEMCVSEKLSAPNKI